MASENLMQLAQILNATLELDASVRKAAEQQLLGLEMQQGFGVMLIELVVNNEAPAEIRIAAAVALKNFVKRLWSDHVEQELPETEQKTIRTAALQAMLASQGNIRSQLSHTVYLMAKKDFPERWPDLVSSLAVLLTQDDFDKIVATLSTLDQLFEKYRHESKSTELWTELKICLIATQEPLTTLFIKMAAFIPQREQMNVKDVGSWLEILLFISHIYHSLISQDLPEFFEDSLGPWMDGFLKLLTITEDRITSAAGEPTALDKIKSEICTTVTLYAQRYEEEIRPYMEPFTQAIWNLLVQTGVETRYDGMVCAALDFLSAISERPQYESMFQSEEVLKTIAIDVAVKNLRLREEDIEMFEDEPLEYMKKDIEGTDTGTRRRGGIDLVRSLCKRFEPQIAAILSQEIASKSGNNNWYEKDVIYCLVTAMASKGETHKSGATNTSTLIDIPQYYRSNVHSDLVTDINSNAILKADAIKFLVTFRNQIAPEDIVASINVLLALLGSTKTQVHKYAAWALERLLIMRINGPIFSSANVQVAPLLTALVSCFDSDPKAEMSPYLIKALMRVVGVMDASTASAGGQIAARLVTMVETAIKNQANPVHTHFLFETMCILIKKASSHVAGGLDSSLLPLVETILAQNLEDLIPYALQITGVLLLTCITRDAPKDAYFGFLGFLLRPELWARSSNVPAALYLIEIYLKAAPERVMNEHGTTIFAQYTRLIASKNLDKYGFQLAFAVLPSMEFANGVTEPYAVLFNNMLKRLQGSRTPSFAKNFLIFLAKFAIILNASTLARALESIQSGLFSMIMQRVAGPGFEEFKNLTTTEEKRTIAIGYGTIFRDCSQMLGESRIPLAQSVLQLLEAPAVTANFGLTIEDEQVSMYNAEGEFVNPFSKLASAGKEDVLAPNISDHKGFFTECMRV
ncbi:unnamed protein product, partial [Mesorhabditis belari]|uniref:Exportin-2 n=1 Tax=Mesorhabditis belari TaxID=2138241 RepID=A0AAF3FNB9_9BILA